MKKLTLKYLSILFAFAMIFTSCSDDDTDVDLSQERLASLYFNSDSGNHIVIESQGEATVKIPVAASHFYNADRKFKITVDEDATTAPASSYSINEASFVVPANEIGGFVDVTLNYDPAVAIAENFKIVLDLDSDHPNLFPIENSFVGLTYTLNFQQLTCEPIDLEAANLSGQWNYSTTGSHGFGSPEWNGPLTGVATITSNGDGTFKFSDVSGGGYTLIFGSEQLIEEDLNSDACGAFSGSFLSGYSGGEGGGPDTITYEGTYDPENDTITLIWSGDFGYPPPGAIEGTTVYTR
ncbi:hypothetical protein [Aureivirga sp. CE67]|uniref:hypothetical protein n=1 Tax=Aureivirga sp. CE67 TaxID=1788983 RepID=UPI0018CAE14F|nr:hypothetical protein [Aureivirga sp. CE67]